MGEALKMNLFLACLVVAVVFAAVKWAVQVAFIVWFVKSINRVAR